MRLKEIVKCSAIAIILLLLVIIFLGVIPTFGNQVRHQRQINLIKDIDLAVQTFELETGRYPESLSDARFNHDFQGRITTNGIVVGAHDSFYEYQKASSNVYRIRSEVPKTIFFGGFRREYFYTNGELATETFTKLE